MSKKILECQYCKSIITEKDTTCPKCGANCSDVIKKYHQDLEEEENAKKEELENQKKASLEQVNKFIKVGIGVPFIIYFLVFAIILITIIIGISTSVGNHGNNPKTKDTETGTIMSQEQGKNYTITIDEYETYEYYDDFFKDCNTKDGYQRVAFHFMIENTSDQTISTSSIVSSIDLKAEDEVVYQSDIKADTHFCDTIQGKEEYTKLPSTKVLSGDKVSGYLGFEIPKNKEKIKFVIDDDIIIEMDNPVYEA